MRFEVAKGYEDKNINLPVRKTKYSAGYDFEVAEDIVIYPQSTLNSKLSIQNAEKMYNNFAMSLFNPNFLEQLSRTEALSLDEIAAMTKECDARPTLVPTGVKCQLDDDKYLQLSIRSSGSLKHWLMLANGVGIIDSDYYSNQDNDGHIYFQVINLSLFPVQLKKGDIIGQGIIQKYYTTEDDNKQEKQTRQGGFGSTSE